MTILPSLIEALERHERVAAPDARIVYHAGTHTSETCPEIWRNSVTLKRIDLAGTSESWLVAVGYEHFTVRHSVRRTGADGLRPVPRAFARQRIDFA